MVFMKILKYHSAVKLLLEYTENVSRKNFRGMLTGSIYEKGFTLYQKIKWDSFEEMCKMLSTSDFV